MARPRILVIAGPNGAGKTTFAREYLPHAADCPQFVNADLIAAGLSPFAPTNVRLLVDVYQPIVDAWTVYDTAGSTPTPMARGPIA